MKLTTKYSKAEVNARRQQAIRNRDKQQQLAHRRDMVAKARQFAARMLGE